MHAYIPGNESRRRGSALVTLMVIVLAVSIAGAAMVSFAKQQAYSVARIRDNMKAQAYAEAGINQAYNAIKTAFANATDPSQFPVMTFNDGGFDVTVTMVGDDRASLVSVGQSGNATITVKADVKNMLPATPGAPGADPILPPTSPWAYTLFVNGDITHNGVSDVKAMVQCNGKITANGNVNWGSPIEVRCVASVRLNGGGSSIDGTVMSPSISGSGTTGSKITTKIVGPVDVVAMPVIDLAPYFAIAQANGQVFSGGTYSGNLGIPGGVAWFNGNVTLQSVTYEGCIIATGNIEFKGGVNQTKLGQLPAVISRDGNVLFNGARDITGLVYAKGDVRFNGAGTLTGTIIAGGNCTFNGNSGVLAYGYSEPPADPLSSGGTPGTTADHVVITAWQ